MGFGLLRDGDGGWGVGKLRRGVLYQGPRGKARLSYFIPVSFKHNEVKIF